MSKRIDEQALHQQHYAEIRDKVASDPYAKSLGIRLTKFEETLAEAELVVQDHMVNAYGTAHGAVIYALADHVMSVASNAHGKASVGLSTNAQFIQAAKPGDLLTARAIETLGKPVIARVQGFALGGGLELAMCCHLRIASEKARLGLPEITLGLLPGFGGTQRMLRLAGRAATLELCLTGQPVDAARALALGLVNRVVAAEALDTEVEALASQLAGSAPHALAGILDAVVRGGECPLDEGLDYETKAFALCCSTADMREGTSAFLERRKPAFTGT